MPYLSCNGSLIYYEKWGKGKPIIALHGAFEDLTTWSALKKINSYTFYCLDLPYHGKTKSNFHKRKSIEEELAIFVEKLGLERFALMSSSLSTRIASKYAANHSSKVAALVMVNYRPLLPSEKFARTFVTPYKNAIVPCLIIMQRFFPELTNLMLKRIGSKVVDYLIDPGAKLNFDCKEKELQLRYVIDVVYSLEPELKKISKPVFIINGQNGRKIIHRIKKLNKLDNCDVIVIPNAGHRVQKENPELFVPTLMKWLEKNYD